MYIHLGADTVVYKNDIVAVLDLETTTVSKITRGFLLNSQKSGKVKDVSINDLPKSYVICERKGDYYVYISPVSAKTLLKRVEEDEVF